MIAIQMEALKLDDMIILNFTKVLDEIIPGDDVTDNGGEAVDRGYWEKKSSKKSLEIVDRCLEIINEFDSSLQLKYNKFYIALADQFRAKNFVIFRGKKQFLKVEARIKDQEPWKTKLEEAGIGCLIGGKQTIWLKFQLKKDELEESRELIKDLFQACYQEYQE